MKIDPKEGSRYDTKRNPFKKKTEIKMGIGG
jgi:hypothetical protein